MSPASYQTAPPRVAMGRGKRDSNPRPQPWPGCALPTELFPRAVGQSNRSVGFFVPPPPPPPPPPLTAPCRPCRPSSGGEGGRTPDLVHAILALSHLIYAPAIFGPAKRRPAGTRALIWPLERGQPF